MSLSIIFTIPSFVHHNNWLVWHNWKNKVTFKSKFTLTSTVILIHTIGLIYNYKFLNLWSFNCNHTRPLIYFVPFAYPYKISYSWIRFVITSLTKVSKLNFGSVQIKCHPFQTVLPVIWIYLNFSFTAEMWKNGRLVLLRTVAAACQFVMQRLRNQKMVDKNTEC